MAISQPILSEKRSEQIRTAIETGSRDRNEGLFKLTLVATLAFALLVLGVLLYDVVTDAWPVFADRFGLLMSNPTRTRADESGVFQGLRGTFWIGIFVILLTFPTGIAAAIYLEEYAPDNWLTRLININIRNLA